MITYNPEDINNIDYKNSLIYLRTIQYFFMPIFLFSGLILVTIFIFFIILFSTNLVLDDSTEKYKFISIGVLPFCFCSLGPAFNQICDRTNIGKFSYEDIGYIQLLTILGILTFGISGLFTIKIIKKYKSFYKTKIKEQQDNMNIQKLNNGYEQYNSVNKNLIDESKGYEYGYEQ